MNLLNRDFSQMKIAGQHTPFWGGQHGRFLHLVLTFNPGTLSITVTVQGKLTNPLISVVQTGVKSAGCEKRTIHFFGANSENLIFPFVVTASKSGAKSPIRNICVFIVSIL
jgi:hypothetical protein